MTTPSRGGLTAVSRRRASGVARLRAPVEMTALALFVHAGTLKPLEFLERLPFDLTVASGGVVLVSVVARVASGARLPTQMGIVVLFLVVLAPSVIGVAPSEYAREKALNFFTLTVLAAIAPAVLVSSRRSADLLLTSLAFFGSFAAIYALVYGQRTEFGNRLGLGPDGSGPIGLGRLAGLAAVVLLANALYGYRFRRTAAAFAAVSAVTVVLTLSQGPLLATAAGGVIVLFGGRRHTNVLSFKVVAGLAVVGVAATAGASLLSAQQGRALSELGTSETARLEMWELVLGERWSLFLGNGFGSFSANGEIVAEYPHNLVLEVLYESGGFAAAVTVALVVAGLVAARSVSRRGLVGVTVAGVLVATLINAMVSADLNGNRPLFMMISVALTLSRMDLAEQPESRAKPAESPRASVVREINE